MAEEPCRPTNNILLGSELVDMTDENGVTLYLKKGEQTYRLSFDVRNESCSMSTRDEPRFGPSSYGRLTIKLNGKWLTYGISGLCREFNSDLQ